MKTNYLKSPKNTVQCLEVKYFTEKFLELYKTAINDAPYSFAYLRLDENPAEFYLRFEKKLYP